MIVHVNGTMLSLARHGSGMPMLMMHGGLGLDHTYFRPWIDPLGGVSELVYYDHRGNGRSARPDLSEATLGTWVDDADALRRELGFERIIVFGHSFGGFVAQEYALRFPDRVRALVLCCTTSAMDFPEVNFANAQTRGTAEQVAALTAAFSGPVPNDEAFREGWLHLLPLYFEHYDTRIAEEMDSRMRYSAEAFNRSFFTCTPQFSTAARLHTIEAPTLIMAGRGDWLMPPAYGADRLHAGISGSTLKIFERSGHFPFIEEQDGFLKTMKDWLSTISDALHSA